MRVFISWSGDTSKAVATALHDWLPKVIQYAKPWLSNHDIPSGSRWPFQLGESLQDLKTGILCLTPDNLASPWILFEAGALSKTLGDTLVCPYLFRLEGTAVEWPLAQFQSEKADKEGTRKLLTTINDAAGDVGLETERLTESFEMRWPPLEERLADIPSQPANAPERRDRELLEEILTLVRDINRATHTTYAAGTTIQRNKVLDALLFDLARSKPLTLNEALEEDERALEEKKRALHEFQENLKKAGIKYRSEK